MTHELAMNIRRFSLFLLFFLITSPLYAFPCFMTVVKGACWRNYEVNVSITDPLYKKEFATVTIPKGKLWGRSSFNCEPGLAFSYKAFFNPPIWADDEKKPYFARERHNLPQAPNPTESGWNILVCYPKDFSEIPYPPDAHEKCDCDFRTVPPVNL